MKINELTAEIEDLLADIQCWMLENDYETEGEGKEIFDRISRIRKVDWDKCLNDSKSMPPPVNQPPV